MTDFPLAARGSMTLTATVLAWAEHEGARLPVPRRRADVYSGALLLASQRLGVDHPAWVVLAATCICEYCQGHMYAMRDQARDHMCLLVREFGAERTLRACASAVAAGAGLNGYASNPLAFTRYVGAILVRRAEL